MKTPRSSLAIALSLVALFLVSAVSPGFAAGAIGDSLTIVGATDRSPLRSGGSNTVWNVALPPATESRCSGDSARDGYFVYGYVVSAAVDPADLTFTPASGVDAISGQRAYTLFDNLGKAFKSRNTAPQTGQVLPPLGGFRFDRLAVDNRLQYGWKIPTGSYNVGLACWNGNARKLDKFWNTTVSFSADDSDPNGLVWRATAATPVDDGDEGGPAPVVVALPLVGAAGIAGALIRRRSLRGGTES